MKILGVRDDLDDELPIIGGSIAAHLFPDDLTLSTDAELAEWKQEIADAQARKRPAGFAAWPVEAEQVRRLRSAS